MEIKHASLCDLDALAAAETACFPPTEAASRETLAARIARFGEHFWLLYDGGTLVSFVDGMVSDDADLSDAMFGDAGLHHEAGAWQMIFGVGTVPGRRGRDCAALPLRRAVEDARLQGRKGVVLTCKAHMLGYYARFGFKDEGVCSSSHGGAAWHQMRLTF